MLIRDFKDKTLYIPNDDKLIYLSCKLVKQFGTNQSKFSKITQSFNPTKKINYKNLGASVFYSPMSPPCLVYCDDLGWM